jgi:hypothetical protein
MSRTFKTVDYEATLDQTVRLGDCLPPDHLARFIVDVIAQRCSLCSWWIIPAVWRQETLLCLDRAQNASYRAGF